MSTQNIIIRECELKDIPYLTSLTKELGYDTTTDQMTERMSNIMTLNNYWTFVAVAEDMVVGYIGLIKNYFWEQDGPYLRVQALVVNADYRKLGVGQKLIQAAEQLARNHNIKTIVLNCTNREERQAAHKFYPKLGFESKSTGYVKQLK
ncbi:MAG: GNAT family N-acetyltransferase [Sediminibacterium sp.]|nr:GNAT family N-acetyltransferase [Sediminibacterium sp.]